MLTYKSAFKRDFTCLRKRSSPVDAKTIRGSHRPRNATLIMYLKHWEIIADNLSKAGWSWGCVSAVDSSERTIFAVDAHRDGKRSVNGREKKSSTNSPSRATAASKDKRNLLPLSVPFAQLNRKTLRWEEVSQALCVMKKSQAGNTTWL